MRMKIDRGNGMGGLVEMMANIASNMGNVGLLHFSHNDFTQPLLP